MNYLEQMEMWRDLACALMEFIEYDMILTPNQERKYADIKEEFNN